MWEGGDPHSGPAQPAPPDNNGSLSGWLCGGSGRVALQIQQHRPAQDHVLEPLLHPHGGPAGQLGNLCQESVQCCCFREEFFQFNFLLLFFFSPFSLFIFPLIFFIFIFSLSLFPPPLLLSLFHFFSLFLFASFSSFSPLFFITVFLLLVISFPFSLYLFPSFSLSLYLFLAICFSFLLSFFAPYVQHLPSYFVFSFFSPLCHYTYLFMPKTNSFPN